MEFGIEKCAMQVMKSGKRHMTEGVELQNQEKIRTLRGKEIYNYLGILEADTIKQQEIKEKFFKKVSKKSQKITRNKTLLQETCQRDKYLGSPLIRYSGPFLKWTREELKQMDQRTRKLMTMHKALHPRDDIDRLYVLK